MPKRVQSRLKNLRPIFLRQWREFRGLSQPELVERMKERLATASISTISRIENGKQAYTQPILEAAAWALGCEPEDILVRNPMDKTAPWSIWDDLKQATPEDHANIVRITKALLKKTG